MKVTAKQAALSFIAILLIGSLGMLYFASRVIIFTNKFSTTIEVSQPDSEVSHQDIYAVLNRIAEIRTRDGDCPNSLGDCWSVDGNIIIHNNQPSPEKIRIRVSTTELTGIWSPAPNPDRHDAFAKRVFEAFRAEGFVAEEPTE